MAKITMLTIKADMSALEMDFVWAEAFKYLSDEDKEIVLLHIAEGALAVYGKLTGYSEVFDKIRELLETPVH